MSARAGMAACLFSGQAASMGQSVKGSLMNWELSGSHCNCTDSDNNDQPHQPNLIEIDGMDTDRMKSPTHLGERKQVEKNHSCKVQILRSFW